MHISHVRTTTPTHSHSTHELYLQLCTFYFYLDLTVYALTFITMFFILAFILILPRLVATTFRMFRLCV